MKTRCWLWKGLKEDFRVSQEKLLEYGMIVFLTALVSVQTYRNIGAPVVSVVDLFAFSIGNFMYTTWIMPMTAVLMAINLHLRIRKKWILHYNTRRNAWIELIGKTISSALCYGIVIILTIFIVGVIISKGTFNNENDPYSLVQIMLHGVYVDPVKAFVRPLSALFIHMFFIGMVVTGISWFTGQEYYGIIVALVFIFMGSKVGVFPTVTTSYYYFILPDYTLLFAFLRTAIIWSALIILNRKRQWEVL